MWKKTVNSSISSLQSTQPGVKDGEKYWREGIPKEGEIEHVVMYEQGGARMGGLNRDGNRRGGEGESTEKEN